MFTMEEPCTSEALNNNNNNNIPFGGRQTRADLGTR